MPSEGGKPTVFVSSTIYDMRDLRAAVKFWLEEMGFEVQLSDHTDFDHEPEAGAFDACFERIRDSDYYLLFIGDRVGSWYDEPGRISVTRQEYREARRSFEETGRPRMIVLARQGVLGVLRERKRARASAATPSTLDDPEVIADFVTEVRREHEVAEAVAGRGSLPRSNWLSGFEAFRDVVDILRSTMRLKGPLSRVAILENLRTELEYDLRLFLSKSDGRIFNNVWWADRGRKGILVKADSLSGGMALSHSQIKNLAVYCMTGVVVPEAFQTAALREAIISGALLEYDREKSTFVVPELLNALYKLRELFGGYESRYSYIAEGQGNGRWYAYWVAVKDDPSSVADVPVDDVVMLFGVHDAHVDLYRLILAVLRHMYGHTPNVELQLRPISPIEGEDEKLLAERVSEDELVLLLSHDNLTLRLADPADPVWNWDITWRLAVHYLGDELALKTAAGSGTEALQRLISELVRAVPLEDLLRSMVRLQVSGNLDGET